MPILTSQEHTCAGLIGFLFMLRALVAANFNTIYIYTAEVYPTPMRALGMGTSGSLCRIGAMVAPFISQKQEIGLGSGGASSAVGA
ncbi:hypothetical protein STEG23_028802 [Scotinomys teguina]